MALTKDDLQAIEHIMAKKVKPVKAELKELREDVSGMKKDLQILARIAQLDLIKQEKRLNYLTAD